MLSSSLSESSSSVLCGRPFFARAGSFAFTLLACTPSVRGACATTAAAWGSATELLLVGSGVNAPWPCRPNCVMSCDEKPRRYG